VKVTFWNVAGLKSKDKGFWEGLKEWDVVFLMETWVDKKGWESIVGKLPRDFRWEVQWASRKNRKGRAVGGMLLGVRKEMVTREEKEWKEREGIMVKRVRVGGEWWRIVGVYINGGIEVKLEDLREWMEGKGEKIKTIVGGDFNARTGERGGK